jgi:phosphoserine phosphatase
MGFLKLVEHPIAFNPNQNLKAAAEANGWKIVVEKKDVVYEISAGATRPLQKDL